MRNLMVIAISVLSLSEPALAAEVRGVRDHEIVVGTYTDMSGVSAEWGVNNSNAYRMAFDERNAIGGINGRKIRYIVEDSQYQVPRAVQAANKLINLDKVFVMVANGGTPMNNATMPLQFEKNIPNVFPLTSARAMYQPLGRLKFVLTSSYYDQIRAAVKFFVERRGKKAICVAAQDTDFGRDVREGVYDQLKVEPSGASLAAETSHKPTDTDFTAAVAKLKDSKCDLVVLGTIVRDAIQLVTAIRKTGWDVDIVGHIATYDSAVAEVPGGVTEGLYAMTAVLFVAADDPRPEVAAFARRYKELFGRNPNFAAQIGYSGARTLMAALEKAGRNLNVDTFVAGLESIKDEPDIFGAAPVTFSPDRHQGSSASFLAHVKNGKWQPVSTDPIGY